MLFLFIEDRGESVVGVFDVTAQVSDILLLFIGIANGDSALGDRSMSSRTGITTIASHDGDAPAHIADKVLAAGKAATAQAHAAGRSFKTGLIIEIREAERASIQLVFIGSGRRANHRTVELSVLADGDIKTPFACEGSCTES
ncbi:Uncharacterised protein [Yersinia rohdei]|uniref:Uncharacterized protein n=1 Tax=Yersinia rohdei TaxID=29485 RepID=A0A0U1HYC3_YERRO|nr:Uncharacterised protein [Yersinia rohdei]